MREGEKGGRERGAEKASKRRRKERGGGTLWEATSPFDKKKRGKIRRNSRGSGPRVKKLVMLQRMKANISQERGRREKRDKKTEKASFKKRKGKERGREFATAPSLFLLEKKVGKYWSVRRKEDSLSGEGGGGGGRESTEEMKSPFMEGRRG